MQTTLLLLLLAAALAPVAGSGHRILAASLWLAAALGSLAIPDTRESARSLSRRPLAGDEARLAGDYVTSDSCRSCHPSEYASWHASYHRTMTQRATPTAVVADFDDVQVARGDGTVMRLRTVEGRFFASFEPGENEPRQLPRESTEIVQVTGSHHIQTFWYSAGRGRELALVPFVWLIAERRWIPVESAFLMPPETSLHTEPGAWNRICLNCHTTGPQPRLPTRPDTAADTRVAEFGISCEACHGPGGPHVAANRDPIRRYALRLSNENHDDTVVHPERLDEARSSEVCGQCHSVSTSRPGHFDTWRTTGYPFRPGDELRETRLVIEPGAARRGELSATTRAELDDQLAREPALVQTTFWPDGVARVSGREYSAMIDSPCFSPSDPSRPGMTCTSCHAMHGSAAVPLTEWRHDQPGHTPTGRSLLGDAGCVQCHDSYSEASAVEAHTFHPAASTGSSCTSCHMSRTTYGLLGAIASHTIESPDVAVELATGRPNACNQCHLDRTRAWTADLLEQRYGTARPELDADSESIAASILWATKGDAGLRALTAWYFGDSSAIAASVADDDWMIPWLAELARDPYDAVRFIARRSMQQHALIADDAVGYDFLANTEQRETFRDRILSTWRRGASARREAAHLLIGPGGALLVAEVERLLAQRDLRPVFLGE